MYMYTVSTTWNNIPLVRTERLTFLSPRFGALTDVTKEYGLEDDSLMVAMCKIKEIMSETWRQIN
jgi:hypothetical protein